MIRNEAVTINGDGETSRDFCYIDNAVQANLLAATANDEAAINQVFNIAVSDRTTLNQLYFHLRDVLGARFAHLHSAQPVYRDFRPGDVQHSLTDIGKASQLPGYQPTHRVTKGLTEAMDWYIGFLSAASGSRG